MQDMCMSMNRGIASVLLSGPPVARPAGDGDEAKAYAPHTETSVATLAARMAEAKRVVIVPGCAPPHLGCLEPIARFAHHPCKVCDFCRGRSVLRLAC